LEKSSRSDFQEEDIIAINQIIIRCAVRIQRFIDRYPSPIKYADKMAAQLKSNKNIGSIFLFSQLTTLKNDALYSPSELKAKVLQDMTKEIVSNKNMSL
jgi:hypothetical protein